MSYYSRAGRYQRSDLINDNIISDDPDLTELLSNNKKLIVKFSQKAQQITELKSDREKFESALLTQVKHNNDLTQIVRDAHLAVYKQKKKIAELNKTLEESGNKQRDPHLLLELALKLNYQDIDDMLREHDLLCPVCLEPTTTKILECNHSLCMDCMSKVHKCPICRTSI